MIKTLRKKFILVNMLLVLIVLLVVFGAVTATSYRIAVNASRFALQVISNRHEPQSAGAAVIGQSTRERVSAYSPIFLVRVVSDGTLSLEASLNTDLSDADIERIVRIVCEKDEAEGTLSSYNLRWLMRTERGVRWIAFIETTAENTAIRNASIIALLSLLGALVAFFAVSLFLSRWALRPVERAWEQQRRFVADASHELKTPLTVIMANTGILLENTHDTIDNQLRWVENTAEEAARMKQLVGNLLFLAKTDDARTTFVFSRANLSDIVFGTALSLESLAYEKGVEIKTSEIEPDIFVKGDESALRQLASILLENALKFSDKGGAVTVALHRQQQKAVFTVGNKGTPLTDEERSRIFDRFYRADTARAGEGYGLGLAIAKGVVEAHRGKISVESSHEHGTVFTVRL